MSTCHPSRRVPDIASPDLAAALTQLPTMTADAIAADYERFERHVTTALGWRPVETAAPVALVRALRHAFGYVYQRWDGRVRALFPLLEACFLHWGREPSSNLAFLCELYDILFFLLWCFDDSASRQAELGLPMMRRAAPVLAAGLGAAWREEPRLQRRRAGEPVEVAYLAMFAQRGNPMSVALRHIVPALLLAGRARFRLHLYAWRFAEPEWLHELATQGVAVHRLEAPDTGALARRIVAQAELDRPAIVISDMNNAVPTALFARRVAPVQIFLQAGMPIWAVPNLDAVLNSWGADPAVAGWGRARLLGFEPPWDLPALIPPTTPSARSDERGKLPPGRLIGVYGRLVKLSPAYLNAIERILERCPDVTFVAGGTGDPGPVRAFAAASPVGDRLHVHERWVPGHVWGYLLDLFLDTWPLAGGESAREMIAKGKAVVSMHSAELPAIDAQRDPLLVAHDALGYVERAVTLLRDPAALAQAERRSRALAQRHADPELFRRQLVADLDGLLRTARHPWRSFLSRWRQAHVPRRPTAAPRIDA